MAKKFGNGGRSTDPHFAWHELVERYIEGSGVAWCHLHPHVFMENLLTVMRPVGGALRWPMGDKPVGWVASDDIAAVAARVLAEGPERHAGKNYYLSTDVLNGMEVAGVLSRATDRRIQALVMTPDDLALGVASGQVVMPGNIEANYAASMLEWARQTFDGRMALWPALMGDDRHRCGRCSADRRSNWKTGRSSIAPTSEPDENGCRRHSFPHHCAYSDGFWGRTWKRGYTSPMGMARTRPS